MIGLGAFWVQADDLAEIGDGLAEIALRTLEVSAGEISRVVARIGLDRAVEIGQGLGIAPGLAMREATIGVGRRIFRIELDGAGKISHGLAEPAGAGKGHATGVIGLRIVGVAADHIGQRADIRLLRRGIAGIVDLRDRRQVERGHGFARAKPERQYQRHRKTPCPLSALRQSLSHRPVHAGLQQQKSVRSISDAFLNARSHCDAFPSRWEENTVHPRKDRHREAILQDHFAFFGAAAIRPSRCMRLRASLRARRTASAFSRARFSDGFS